MDKPWTTHRLTVDAAEGERTATPGDMLGREWLLTNGTGGYSMGTALGCNTRRYHGLLIAAALAAPKLRPKLTSSILHEQLAWI